VTVVGRTTGSSVVRSRLGPVRVLDVPTRSDLAHAERMEKARDEADSRLRDAGLPGLVTPPASLLGRALSRATAASSWVKEPDAADWRRSHPLLLDLDLSLGPVLEDLVPNLIVADGIATLNTAAVAVARLRAAGQRVHWLYVVHPHAGSTSWSSDLHTAAFRSLEREFVGRADLVAARSSEVAAAVAADSNLGVRPEVVYGAADEPTSGSLPRMYRRITGLTPEPRPSVSRSAPLQPGRRGPKHEKHEAMPWRPLGDTPIRLGLGMANYAGQLSAYAQAVTTAMSGVSAEVITRATATDFGYPTDVRVSIAETSTLAWQISQLQRVLPHYSHLLADAFLPVFGSLNGPDISFDLPALANAEIDVALLAHGSEVRHPLRHLERVPHSLFNDAPAALRDTLVRTAERNHEIAAAAQRPVFVTTPDLLDDLPDATWVPLVVDVDKWHCDQPVMERRRPIVLHAPSSRWTKGTDRFVPDLERLAASGAIELRLVEGRSWSEMRDLVKDCDIVVDQVAIGSYGTFACEAMAAGKPVLAYITETVADAVGASGTPLPLINTSPEGVAHAVEDLLDDRRRAMEIGVASLEFVRRVHDGTRSAGILRTWLAADD
jgi:hypothetical protein